MTTPDRAFQPPSPTPLRGTLPYRFRMDIKPTLWERFCAGFVRGWESVDHDLRWVREDVVAGNVDDDCPVWPLLTPDLDKEDD